MRRDVPCQRARPGRAGGGGVSSGHGAPQSWEGAAGQLVRRGGSNPAPRHLRHRCLHSLDPGPQTPPRDPVPNAEPSKLATRSLSLPCGPALRPAAVWLTLGGLGDTAQKIRSKTGHGAGGRGTRNIPQHSFCHVVGGPCRPLGEKTVSVSTETSVEMPGDQSNRYAPRAWLIWLQTGLALKLVLLCS